MSGIAIRWTYVGSPLAVAALFALAALASALVYRRSFRARPRWIPCALAALRFGAISTALVLILRPVASTERFERKESRAVVLVDRSRSMAARDSVGGEPRIATAHRVAASEAVERLGRAFRLERYAFSGPGTLERWDPERPADGRTTDLASAWNELPGGPPVAAIVLLSDGRDHGGALARGGEPPPGLLPAAPVYAVGLGSGGLEALDASWTRAACDRRVLRGSRASVRGSIRLRGAEGVRARVSARLGQEVAASREVELSEGANDVSLEIAPDRGGLLVYELRVELSSPDAVPENDAAHVILEVEENPLQVLYLEGRLRPQYKFALAALEKDPRLNVSGVVLLGGARRLERGSPPVELRDGFPAAPEALRAFDALIIGNVVAEELPPEAPAAIVRRVDEGAGIIFAAGLESLPSLGATELDELLPLSAASPERIAGELSVRVPLAASDHPIVRGLGIYFSPERPGGPFLLAEGIRAGRLRPGAEALLAMAPAARGAERAIPAGAEAREAPRGASEPLLAARRYGKGRALLWATESEWRWRTERAEEGGARLLETLWSRMVRWVAGREDYRAGEVRVRLEREVVRAGEEAAVEVEGAAAVAPAASVEAPGGGRRPLVLEATPEAGGLWRAKFVPEVPGAYRIEASAAGGERAAAVLVAEPDVREVEDVSPDWGLLRRIAAATGGRFFTAAEAGALGEAIVREAGGKAERVELALDRGPAPFALLVGLLSLEWILRRRIHTI